MPFFIFMATLFWAWRKGCDTFNLLNWDCNLKECTPTAINHKFYPDASDHISAGKYMTKSQKTTYPAWLMQDCLLWPLANYLNELSASKTTKKLFACIITAVSAWFIPVLWLYVFFPWQWMTLRIDSKSI